MLLIDRCRLSWPDFSADYSLRVARGHLCAVIGPSGGGKTTLLHMIAGFETPDSGTLSFDGQDLRPLAPARRPVSLVFQDHNLFPHLDVRQNVALGIRPSLRLSPEDEAAVAGAIAAVELEGLAGRRPGELSGGQRQRVALARALVSERRLMLLDEPFSSLDPGLRRAMIALVDRLRRERGITVVMTIHTPEDVVPHADQLALVEGGSVRVAGPPEAVLRQAASPGAPGHGMF